MPLLPIDLPLDLSGVVVGPAALLFVTAGIALLLRGVSAAARHLLWSFAIAGALLLPLLSVAMPKLSVPVPRSVATAVTSLSPGAIPSPPPARADGPAAAVAASRAGEPSVREALAARAGWIWLAGAIPLLCLLGLHAVRVRRLESRSEVVRDPEMHALVERLRCQRGISRPVRLLFGAADGMPMTWGLRVPRILLPGGADRWPRAQLEAVVLHELAHVRRGDVFVQAVAEIGRVIYWFNPFMWYACRRLLIEREHACDDEVILAGVNPPDYAHQLLAITGSLRAARATAHAAISMARRSQMTGRLLAILDGKRSRWRPSAKHVAMVAAAVAVAVMSGATLRPAFSATPDAARSSGGPDAAPVPVRIDTGDLGDRPTRRQAEWTSGCWNPVGRGTNSNRNRDDDHITAEWRTARCSGRLSLEGVATVSADSGRIVSLPPRGSLWISETEGPIRRIIRASASGDGQPRFTGSVNDHRVSSSDVERWLAANLRPLLRLTGIDVAVQTMR